MENSGKVLNGCLMPPVFAKLVLVLMMIDGMNPIDETKYGYKTSVSLHVDSVIERLHSAKIEPVFVAQWVQNLPVCSIYVRRARTHLHGKGTYKRQKAC